MCSMCSKLFPSRERFSSADTTGGWTTLRRSRTMTVTRMFLSRLVDGEYGRSHGPSLSLALNSLPPSRGNTSIEGCGCEKPREVTRPIGDGASRPADAVSPRAFLREILTSTYTTERPVHVAPTLLRRTSFTSHRRCADEPRLRHTDGRSHRHHTSSEVSSRNPFFRLYGTPSADRPPRRRYLTSTGVGNLLVPARISLDHGRRRHRGRGGRPGGGTAAERRRQIDR